MNDDSSLSYDLFVDTSGWYAVTRTSDPYHQAATESFRRLTRRRGTTFSSNFVVAETHALLMSRFGTLVALQFLRSLPLSAVFIERVTSDDEVEAIAILSRYSDKDFSYTDAVSFAMMRRLGTTEALTADRHFVQFGFQQARG